MDEQTLREIEQANQQLLDAMNQSSADAEQAMAAGLIGFGVLFLVIAAVVLVVCAFAGAYIASQKRRSKIEGVLLGGFFGVFGLIIEALLPQGQPMPLKRNWHERPWLDVPDAPDA